MKLTIDFLDTAIKTLQNLKREQKKKEKISKALHENFDTLTAKRRGAKSASLNWQCLEIEKITTDFARLFKGSALDVETEQKEVSPSGFQDYKI